MPENQNWVTGFILYKEDYGENSERLLFLSLEKGLIHLYCKGAKSKRSKLGPILQYFSLLKIQLIGRFNNYINKIEIESIAIKYLGENYYCACYINELFTKFLEVEMQDTAETLELFELYKNSLMHIYLAQNFEQRNLTLRFFELQLLRYLGLLQDFSHTAQGNQVDAKQTYYLLPEQGLISHLEAMQVDFSELEKQIQIALKEYQRQTDKTGFLNTTNHSQSDIVIRPNFDNQNKNNQSHNSASFDPLAAQYQEYQYQQWQEMQKYSYIGQDLLHLQQLFLSQQDYELERISQIYQNSASELNSSKLKYNQDLLSEEIVFSEIPSNNEIASNDRFLINNNLNRESKEQSFTFSQHKKLAQEQEMELESKKTQEQEKLQIQINPNSKLKKLNESTLHQLQAQSKLLLKFIPSTSTTKLDSHGQKITTTTYQQQAFTQEDLETILERKIIELSQGTSQEFNRIAPTSPVTSKQNKLPYNSSMSADFKANLDNVIDQLLENNLESNRNQDNLEAKQSLYLTNHCDKKTKNKVLENGLAHGSKEPHATEEIILDFYSYFPQGNYWLKLKRHNEAYAKSLLSSCQKITKSYLDILLGTRKLVAREQMLAYKEFLKSLEIPHN